MKPLLLLSIVLLGCSTPDRPTDTTYNKTSADWLAELEAEGKVERVMVTNEVLRWKGEKQ